MVAESASTANDTTPSRFQPTWLALLGFDLATRLIVVSWGRCSALGPLVPQHGNGVSRSREFAYTSQTLDCEAKEVTNARDSGKGQG